MRSAEIRLPIDEEADVFLACQRARELAGLEGFPHAAAEALALAVAEVARNILVHARRGAIAFAAASGPRRGVVLTAEDEGPGILDVERAMQDGFSTGNGLGLGLPSARRLVDEFRLESRPGGPTTVTLKKWA
jgi:serine/threonine-protein kinase RsbT